MIDAVRPLVETAGQVLADCVANIGATPDAHMIAKLGAGATASFAKFNEANGVLNRVRVIVGDAHRAMHATIANTSWVKLDDLDSAALVRLGKCGNFADIVAAGFTLSTNRPDQVAAAVSKIDAKARRVTSNA